MTIINMKLHKYINKLITESKSKFDYYNFNQGTCDLYAIALHRLTGLPLYVARGTFLEPEWGGEREWDYEYAHVMVKIKDGLFLDSDGELTEEQMRSRLYFQEDVQEIEFVPVSEEQARIFSCVDMSNVELDNKVEELMTYIQNKNKTI